MENLKLGAKSADVFQLKLLLTRIGYVGLTLDQNFDAFLDTKIKKFQDLRSLKTDGVVGPKTWEAIFTAAFAEKSRYEGVDISHHENDDLAPADINWAMMRKAFWFCYVKATQGNGYQDPKFSHNIQKLSEINMLRGGYHFMDFFSTEGVQAEVDNFLENCPLDWRAKEILPPCLDVEPTRSGDARLERRITNDRFRILADIKTWLDAVEKATGRKPMIYTSRRVWDDMLGGGRDKGFENYRIWLADYRKSVTQPTPPKIWGTRYDIWQYSEDGAVGKNKGFDVNIINIPYKDLLTLANFK
ncbi:MAG: hypothetical protein RL757_954 [Bacteroidota bacterium]|jgi:lysozyme